ncbi:MAG: chorismate synthase [Candidatus Nealsonbacteria bacterium]|nr:chorismate synthase [Candidatus Nealsonbacteria bacterium]
MLRYLTAGESHGKALLALVDGFPAGMDLETDPIDAELRRRQGGYGRGGRQKLESDHVEVLTGIWRGATLGSPIALLVPNNDYKMEQMDDLPRPRPGHGDLNGSIKHLGAIRPILERASARTTAAAVAAGALAKQLLGHFDITALGYVVRVGPIEIEPKPGTLQQQRELRDRSELYSLDPGRDDECKTLIDKARKSGDTLGGVIEVRVEGVPFGLGSHTQWDKRLDGRLAQAVVAVQAMKGFEIGMGFEAAQLLGSEVHDPIQYDPALVDTPKLGFTRPSNNAGGLEAGMTNSQPIVIRAAKKPISTLAQPLESINLKTKQPEEASYERSDVCAVAAASCILENVVAFEVARSMVDKFGGDSLKEMKARWKLFHEMAREKLG